MRSSVDGNIKLAETQPNPKKLRILQQKVE